MKKRHKEMLAYLNQVRKRAQSGIRSEMPDLYGAYRDPTGQTPGCFIGIFIPDEEYDPEMEGHLLYALHLKWKKLPSIFKRDAGWIEFWNDIQAIHDNADVTLWQGNLNDVQDCVLNGVYDRTTKENPFVPYATI